MSYHLPVIVSNKNYCGFSEHLSESNAILLTNPKDSGEIAEKIKLLYTDHEFNGKMASNGFDKSQTINWNNTLRQTLNAYKRITSN
jgi:glycosyltransferase involved in cell wall biosynthesis